MAAICLVLISPDYTLAKNGHGEKFGASPWPRIGNTKLGKLYKKWLELIRRGQLTQVSGKSPFDGCTADDPDSQPGEVSHNSEVEAWVAVNPLYPNHIVTSWQQDRWSNGGARSNVAAVSFDGGQHWLEVPLPHLTPCSGAREFLRASDPWSSFDPDGDIYHISLLAGRSLIELLEGQSDTGRSSIVVQKSVDGGLNWSEPTTLVDETFVGLHDKPSLTADPHNARFVYAIWDRLDLQMGISGVWFSRTTDRGLSWEEAREIYNPGTNSETLGHQIVVLPDETLIDFFNLIVFEGFTVRSQLALLRSRDHGQTWGDLTIASSMRPLPSLTEPELGISIRSGADLFDVAVDPKKGTLYAVWQDSRFRNDSKESVALSVSEDGGYTWTDPVEINKTPIDIPGANQQAFVPSVAVNGPYAAITYYDFRFNGDEPEALTDYWAVTCRYRLNGHCTQSNNWKSEIRLTNDSFDLLSAPVARGLFLGDYAGLSAVGNRFIAVFGISSNRDPANMFSRRFKGSRR